MATDIKEMTAPVDASSVMKLFPAPPRVLALGEPTHGEDILLDVRNALFRQLVEQPGPGYRTITIETDCLAGRLVDDYVTAGTGTLDEVMEHGFSHGWGASPANRDLVRWMRAHNEGRPAPERLRFAGFDGPLEMAAAASPRQCLLELHGYLAARLDAALLPCTAETLDGLLGPDEPWTDTAVMWDPTVSVGRSADAVELRLFADELVALLDASAPQLRTAAPDARDDWDRAVLYGRTAVGLLRYHYWMADTSPVRLARLAGLRDQMMAGNLLALAERGPVLAHAHNGHLQRDLSSMRMDGRRLEWWSAGALVGTRLGAAYGFLATGLGTIRHHGVGTPAPDTLEGLLYALPEDSCVVDAPRLSTALATAPPAPRASSYYGYAPLDPAHLPRYDGLVFIKDAPRA